MDRYVTDIKNGCYQNPVLPMDFSDPDAIRVGEDYYLISSSFTYLPGAGAAQQGSCPLGAHRQLRGTSAV